MFILSLLGGFGLVFYKTFLKEKKESNFCKVGGKGCQGFCDIYLGFKEWFFISF